MCIVLYPPAHLWIIYICMFKSIVSTLEQCEFRERIHGTEFSIPMKRLINNWSPSFVISTTCVISIISTIFYLMSEGLNTILHVRKMMRVNWIFNYSYTVSYVKYSKHCYWWNESNWKDSFWVMCPKYQRFVSLVATPGTVLSDLLLLRISPR